MMVKKKGNIRKTAVSCSPLFAGILPNDHEAISAMARVTTFRRGELLYLEGDSAHQVFLLTSGSVNITKHGQSGREVLLRLGVPGDVLGVLGVFSTGRQCTSAQACRLSRTLVWDAAVFKAMLERFPGLHHNLVGILGEYLLELEERFGDVAAGRVSLLTARQSGIILKQIGQPVSGGVRMRSFATRRGPDDQRDAAAMPRRETVAICDAPSRRLLSEES